MFKKNLWVVGLIAALAIMFSGCVPPVGGDGEGEAVEVVNLQNIIESKADGLLDTAAWGALFDSTPFQKCGSPNFTIITEGGVKKLQIDGMVNGWGEGLDLTLAKAAFKIGDVLYIKGKVDSGKNGLMVNGKGGAYYRIGEWNSNDDSADGTFEKTFTLTADDITAIKTGSPQVIRFHYGPSDGDARRGKIIFEQITLNGVRGGGAVCECMDGAGCDCGMDKDCGPQCDNCVPDKFAAGGSASDYKIPAPTGLPANEFYLNLASYTTDAIVSSAVDTTAGVTTVAIIKEDVENKVASAVKFYFDKTDQRMNFVFTAAQKALVQEAVDEGEPFKVEISGTGFPDIPVRWGVIKTDTGASYNGTSLTGNNKLSANLSGTLTPTSNKTGTTHFTLQSREGPWLGVVVELRSIKFIMPVEAVINITDLDIAAPVPNGIPQKKLSTSQFDGEIVWRDGSDNDVTNKNFEANETYTATVTLTAKNKFWTFNGFNSTFTAGSLDAYGHVVTAADKTTVQFDFGGITTASPGSVKPQIMAGTPAALADLTDIISKSVILQSELTAAIATPDPDGLNDVLADTEVTATYTKGTNGPIKSTLTILWQYKDEGDYGLWKTQGTGEKYKPGKPGTWRISISAPYFGPEYSDEFNVYQIIKPAPEITVTFAADKTVAVPGNNGTLAYTGGGYTYTYGTVANSNYGNGIVRFKVDLGTSFLGDYKQITLKWTGVAGDIGSKKLYLLAVGTEADITPWKSDALLLAMVVSSNDTGHPDEGWWGGDGPEVDGTTATNVTIPIIKGGSLTGEVWFSIYANLNNTDAGAATAYTVTDVKLVPHSPIP